eukprot:164520-Pelagomonas_calceolata.AAC.1
MHEAQAPCIPSIYLKERREKGDTTFPFEEVNRGNERKGLHSCTCLRGQLTLSIKRYDCNQTRPKLKIGNKKTLKSKTLHACQDSNEVPCSATRTLTDVCVDSILGISAEVPWHHSTSIKNSVKQCHAGRSLLVKKKSALVPSQRTY